MFLLFKLREIRPFAGFARVFFQPVLRRLPAPIADLFKTFAIRIESPFFFELGDLKGLVQQGRHAENQFFTPDACQFQLFAQRHIGAGTGGGVGDIEVQLIAAYGRLLGIERLLQ